MKAEERRQIIAQTLTADKAISATALAGKFSVSRQIIVGDIALLRAAGMDIVATPRGYKLGESSGLLRTVATIHTKEQVEQELLTIVDNGDAMVDCGCTVIDVVVEHPLYGQICGQLSLASRYDVAQYVEKARGTAPLSLLTGGVHLHHLRCPDEAAYQRVCAALDKLGLLYTPEQQNRD